MDWNVYWTGRNSAALYGPDPSKDASVPSLSKEQDLDEFFNFLQYTGVADTSTLYANSPNNNIVNNCSPACLPAPLLAPLPISRLATQQFNAPPTPAVTAVTAVPPAAPAEDPARVRTRERKRRHAQQYRAQRVGQLQEAEAKVAELMQQLEALKTENEALHLRNDVLDGCLQRFSHLHNRLESWKLASGQKADQIPIAVTANSSFNIQADGSITAPTGTTLSTVSPNDANSAAYREYQRFLNLSMSTLAGDWKLFVYDGAALMLKGGSEQTGDLEQEYYDLFKRAERYCNDCSAANLTLMATAWATNLETGHQVTADLSHWQGVAQSIGLRPEQLKEAFLVYQWLSSQFQGIQPEAESLCSRLDAMGSNREHLAAAEYEKTEGALESSSLFKRLQVVSEKYSLCIRLAKHAMFHRLFTKQQAVKALVHSWPYLPDPAGLLIAVANAHKTPVAPSRVNR